MARLQQNMEDLKMASGEDTEEKMVTSAAEIKPSAVDSLCRNKDVD